MSDADILANTERAKERKSSARNVFISPMGEGSEWIAIDETRAIAKKIADSTGKDRQLSESRMRELVDLKGILITNELYDDYRLDITGLFINELILTSKADLVDCARAWGIIDEAEADAEIAKANQVEIDAMNAERRLVEARRA